MALVAGQGWVRCNLGVVSIVSSAKPWVWQASGRSQSVRALGLGDALPFPTRKPVRTTENIGDFGNSTRKPIGNVG